MIGKFLGKLFSSDEAIKQTAGALRDGLDALVYTDEEKANDAALQRTEARQMLLRWMESTQGQNIARRFLAISLSMMWGTIYGFQIVMSAISPWVNPDISKKLMESAAVLGESAGQLNGAMMLILAFYFSAPYMGDIIKPAMNKFIGDKQSNGNAN